MNVLILAAVLAAGSAQAPMPAPRIRLSEWLHGRAIPEASLEVRAVLLELWATW